MTTVVGKCSTHYIYSVSMGKKFDKNFKIFFPQAFPYPNSRKIKENERNVDYRSIYLSIISTISH